MPDNYNDVFAVQVDVEAFKRSLDAMQSAYETFIKGLDTQTRAGLGQGLAGNIGIGLKDLTSTLAEFRKDFTGTIAQLDTNINRFIESIFDKNTSGIKGKVREALDENEKLQEAIRQNAQFNKLTEQEVVSTLESGTTPTKAEKTRRDIDFENERLLRQSLEESKTTLSQVDKTFRDRQLELAREAAREEQQIQSALDKERAAALKQRSRDEDALYKERALREKQSASDSLTAAKQEQAFRADQAKKEAERVSQINETFRKREDAAEKQAAADRLKLQKDIAVEEARIAKEREAQIAQSYKERAALEKQQTVDSIKAAKEEAAFKANQRQQEQRQIAETTALNRSLESVRAQGELAAIKLRAAQAGSPQEQQKILNVAAKEYSVIINRLTQQLQALPPPTTPEALRLQKDLTQELNQARSALTGITNQLKQAEIQSQNFFSKMLHGFKNTLSLVIRFYATFAALQAAIDVIKFTIGAPFEILADGLRYMVGIEEVASNLTGVLAANAVFSKDQAENFKIAAEVSKDLVELLKQRAIASGSTFESLDATFKALLQGGAGQTVRNLEELVQLAEVFQLSIKAAGAGGLAAQGSIQEISKLFQGLPGDYNKFLALLKVTPAEFKKMVAEAKNNRDLLDQLVDRIGPYVDQVKLAELNQARLAKSFGELIDRIGAAGSKPLFNFITEQLKVVVKFLEENFNKIAAFTDNLARSIVHLLSEFTSFASVDSSGLESIFRLFVLINSELLKGVSTLQLFAGALTDVLNQFGGARFSEAEVEAALKSPKPLVRGSIFDQIVNRYKDFGKDLKEINKITEESIKLFNTPVDTKNPLLNQLIGFQIPPAIADKKGGRDALRELLAQLDAAQEKYREASDDITERNKRIRQSIEEQVAERKINYADAAQQIRDNVNAETKELDKLRSSVFSVAKDIESKIKIRIIDPTVQGEALAKLQKDITQFRRQEGRSDFQRETEAIRADKNAAKERLALNKERAEQTLRVEEEALKRRQELLSVYREAGIFTERQYFDEVDKLRAKQFDIDSQRIQAQIDAAGADLDERLKFENQLAVLKAKFSASEEISANRRINLLQQEVQLARDYAVALAQVDIQSQRVLLDTIQSLQPDVGYNSIIAESINLRAQELDLLERNLRVQRDISAERNAESQETRGLNLQLLDLINSRNELFNQRIRAIQSGTSGVLATRSSISGAFDQEFAARQLAVSAAQSRVQAFVSANGVPGIGGFDPQLIGQFQALQNELTLTSRSLEELREEGFKAIFKDFGKIFRADQIARIFGRGFSEAFSNTKTSTDKLVVSLEGAANAANFFIQGVSNIQQGLNQGGTLGGIGAGISSFGGAATGLLSALLPSVGAIPIVGQLAQSFAPVLSFVGQLFTASARRIAEDIKRSFSSTIENYQSGNTSLIDTLNTLERQRTDAIIRLSGTKGGKKELDSILKEFDSQIKQLRDSQKQIITDFEDSLSVLRSSSEVLSEVNKKWQDINNQVKDYIGAGGDAAKAQEFLSLQLGRIRQDAANQLAQAEQDAIQEAIRFNDLLKERQNILDDFAKKEFEVLTRTAIERRKSNVVATGEELANLRKQRDEQLAALDDQIRLANTRLERQKDIFNLELDITSLRRRDEELTLAALDAQLQKLRDLQSIANSISVGPNGLLGSSLLQPANVNVSIDITGMPATEAGLEVVDTIQSELNRRFRMVPVAA